MKIVLSFILAISLILSIGAILQPKNSTVPERPLTAQGNPMPGGYPDPIPHRPYPQPNPIPLGGCCGGGGGGGF